MKEKVSELESEEIKILVENVLLLEFEKFERYSGVSVKENIKDFTEKINEKEIQYFYKNERIFTTVIKAEIPVEFFQLKAIFKKYYGENK